MSGELIRVVAGEDREGCRRGILLMRFSVIAEIGVGVQSEVTLPGLQLLAPRQWTVLYAATTELCQARKDKERG